MSEIVRRLNSEEVRTLVGWAGGEGWNPGPGDADAFYAADAEGFIGCFVDGALVAGISAVAYGSDFGFIGLYICRPEFRGQGYGMQVWQVGMKRLEGRTIGLDGVPEQQANYASMGFVTSYESARWSGSAAGLSADVLPAKPVSPEMIENIISFDQRFFPDAREEFLKAWLSPPREAFAVIEAGEVKGYAVLRACLEGYKVGPIFAESLDVARSLLAACGQAADGAELHIDVPAYQTDFVALLSGAGFSRAFETARMYLGPELEIEKSGVFAVTTLELG